MMPSHNHHMLVQFFEQVDVQIAGLGGIEAIQQIYVDHTAAVIDK